MPGLVGSDLRADRERAAAHREAGRLRGATIAGTESAQKDTAQRSPRDDGHKPEASIRAE